MCENVTPYFLKCGLLLMYLGLSRIKRTNTLICKDIDKQKLKVQV